MKKYFITAAIMSVAFTAQAQVLDVSDLVNSMKMSSEYLNHLEKCSPYQEKKTMDFMGLVQDSVYKVVGKSNEKCLIEITSQTNNNVRVVQKCLLDDQDLDVYVKALKELVKKTEYTLDNMPEMVSDENYLTAMGIIMTDCESVRDEVDLTKEIRKNLVDCTPYTETEKQGNVEITRHIIGRNDAVCDYEQMIFLPAPDLSKISGELVEPLKNVQIPDQRFSYKCSFSAEKLQEFINILQAMVIPAGDAMDFSILDEYNPKAEIDFISENCSLENLK